MTVFCKKDLECLTPVIKTWMSPKQVKRTGGAGDVETCILLTFNLKLYNIFPYSCLEETLTTISDTPIVDGTILQNTVR